MPGLRLHLRTTCVTCGNPIPMRAASITVTCPSCETAKALSPSDYGWIIDTNLKSTLTVSEKVRTALKISAASDGKSAILGEIEPGPVVCGACGASICDAVIEGAPAQGGLTCGCGRDVPYREVSEQLDPERWWTAFVGESYDDRAPAVTAPVSFACPNCGAGLMVDGTTRTPDCGHCATRAFIPDDLWRAVRPTPRAEPFYLWVDPTWYEEWTRLKAKRFYAALLTALLVMLGLAAALAATAFFEPTVDLFGTFDSGGPVPWHERAFFSLAFSWMIAWAAGAIVARRMKPRRPRP